MLKCVGVVVLVMLRADDRVGRHAAAVLHWGRGARWRPAAIAGRHSPAGLALAHARRRRPFILISN